MQVPGEGCLERRVLEINRKRVKVVKPGSKTSFPTTEMRGSYAPPFHVSLFLVRADFMSLVDKAIHGCSPLVGPLNYRII